MSYLVREAGIAIHLGGDLEGNGHANLLLCKRDFRRRL